MPHSTPLIYTITLGLLLAFVFGVLAQRLKLPPLIGYLVAGICVGPFTPGFVADINLAMQLAEVGIILLMFGVGLHFSLEDLLSVRAIAISGALAQIAISIPLAMLLSWSLGWSVGAGLILGLCLSVASTVVVLRILQERRLLDTERGRISVGWLIVQDIAMVLVLVLLPALAPLIKGSAESLSVSELAWPVGLTLAKITAFTLLMFVVGKKVIPGALHYVAHTGNRELFRLAVLAIALGAAFVAAELFGVSLALGAFFAGMLLSESQLSQQAAQESLPLRDAFAVLFFVSVGMLFDPTIVTDAPLALLATVALIVFGKSVAAFLVVRLFHHNLNTSLVVTACLAQIGEFSFILANLGVRLDMLPEDGRDLILAGAILSILINPLLFAGIEELLRRKERSRPDQPPTSEEIEEEALTREPIAPTELTGHIVLIGHGRVGTYITESLPPGAPALFVVEDNPDAVKELNDQGIEAIQGNAADPEVVAAANLKDARCLLVAIPDAFEGGQVVQQARDINPNLLIVARAHSEAEIEHLIKHGASIVVMGEHEIAKAMLNSVTPIAEAMARAAGAPPSTEFVQTSLRGPKQPTRPAPAGNGE
ncbi:YbaL family putative K(+) efflux transporter [Methyloligella sp. 2.7D]|uniref:YbaL family putative K(+) efflux transporter n=1 Tax=unclassified Methyloligella TaxID=2625955 RepID=UPI00157BD3D1|nr:YbaL family putative K(+) efflux transporter [Methyloligella sp. GL2]QKP78526.1 Kef family K(+) transporter [Methyloligella sp. GL2]